MRLGYDPAADYPNVRQLAYSTSPGPQQKPVTVTAPEPLPTNSATRVITGITVVCGECRLPVNQAKQLADQLRERDARILPLEQKVRERDQLIAFLRQRENA